MNYYISTIRGILMSTTIKLRGNTKSDTFTDTVSIVFKMLTVLFVAVNFMVLAVHSKLNVNTKEFLTLCISSVLLIIFIVFLEPFTYKKNKSINFILQFLIGICCGLLLASYKTSLSVSVFFTWMVVIGLKQTIKLSMLSSLVFYIMFILAIKYGRGVSSEVFLLDIHVLVLFLATVYLCHYFSEIVHKKEIQDETIISLSSEKIKLTKELNSKCDELDETYWDMVETLIGVIEARDNFTGGHSIKVCEYSVKLARKAGLSEGEVAKVMQASILHDIGKMGIPDDILLKPGALSNDEYATIMTHPEIGCRVLSKVKGLEDILPMILYHHERVDGTGYPFGLEGDKIPLGAKIIAIADAYDAMTSNRPYRKALAKKEARKRLMENSGTQFDPQLTALFLEIIESDNVENIREYRRIENIKKHAGIV